MTHQRIQMRAFGFFFLKSRVTSFCMISKSKREFFWCKRVPKSYYRNALLCPSVWSTSSGDSIFRKKALQVKDFIRYEKKWEFTLGKIPSIEIFDRKKCCWNICNFLELMWSIFHFCQSYLFSNFDFMNFFSYVDFVADFFDESSEFYNFVDYFINLVLFQRICEFFQCSFR